MPVEGRFDAIVVGAGPAGTTAALSMAKKGLRVLLLERGESPGAKNMSGLSGKSVPVVLGSRKCDSSSQSEASPSTRSLVISRIKSL